VEKKFFLLKSEKKGTGGGGGPRHCLFTAGSDENLFQDNRSLFDTIDSQRNATRALSGKQILHYVMKK